PVALPLRPLALAIGGERLGGSGGLRRFAPFSAGILRILWLGLVADRLGRREAVVDGREVIVFVLDRRLTRLVGTLRVLHLLRCRDDAEVVLGVLQVVFRHDVVTRGLGIAGELQVLLGNM